MDMKKIKYFIFLNVFINYNIFCMNFNVESLIKPILAGIFGEGFYESSDKEKLLAVKNNIPEILKPLSPFLGLFG